jgi:hypothetical protein
MNPLILEQLAKERARDAARVRRPLPRGGRRVVSRALGRSLIALGQRLAEPERTLAGGSAHGELSRRLLRPYHRPFPASF